MPDYRSNNTGNKCTAAQYLAETMCTRQARKTNTDLPLKFWNLPKWKKTYMQQLFRANALIKAYSEEVLVRAIEDNQWLNTLLWNDIGSILDKAEVKLEQIKKQAELASKFKEVDVNTTQKKFVTNSRLSRLKELDNE